MTEFCAPPLMQRMIEKILQKYQVLIKDEYGTFVICSVLEHGDDQHRLFLLNQINHNVKDMSIDRDGSKLLENCIKMIGSSKIQKGSDLDSLQTQILEQVLSLPMPKNFQDNEN